MHTTLPDLPDRPLPPRSPTERLRSWLQWVGPGRLVGSAVVVLAVLSAGYWLVRPPAATTESKLPYAAPHPTTRTERGRGCSRAGRCPSMRSMRMS